VLTADESVNREVEGYLREACYHLRNKGLTIEEISRVLEISPRQVQEFYDQYQEDVAKGVVAITDIDRRLWEDVYNDSHGNEKITFVQNNGFYHCRKADLEKMENETLMSIYETSKKFLDFDMYKPYLDSKPPPGYDPMALQRQVKRATELINNILENRWKTESRDNE
jgi:hypothetical protein